MSKEEINNYAMQIILHAGDCRNYIIEALNMLENDIDKDEIDEKISQAKEKNIIAHQIQTQVIQSTIEDEKFETTLLFSHAQDTLMTINSELILSKHIISLYLKLKG